MKGTAPEAGFLGRSIGKRGRSIGICLILLVLFGYALSTNRIPNMIERPTGCDPFGYLRQAQLVKEKGPIGALSTAIDDPTTRYLINKISELDTTNSSLGGVAPHCHVYKPRTGRVVLQYPPGVGYVFSLFPFGRQAHMALALWITILITTIAWATFSIKSRLSALALLGLGLYCIHGIIWFYTDYSIAPSAGAAVLLGLVGVTYFTAAEPWSRLLLAAVIGILIGLAADFRLPNLFFAVGFAAVLGSDFLLRPTTRKLSEALAMASGMVVGVSPILLTNWLNAGSPFLTTYGGADIDAPRLSLEAFIDGFQFFFIENGTSGIQVIIAALACGAMFFGRRESRNVPLRQASAVALVNLLFTVTYMLLHSPRSNYYLYPAACFAAATGAFCIAAPDRNARTREWPAPHKVLAACAIAILGGALLAFRYWGGPVDKNLSTPDSPPIDARTVVWADLATGFFNYYLHRQSSVLPRVDGGIRQRLIEAIAADGRSQLFLVDSTTMEGVVSDLSRRVMLEPYGKIFGRDAFILRGMH
jgi:hypothetical protein